MKTPKPIAFVAVALAVAVAVAGLVFIGDEGSAEVSAQPAAAAPVRGALRFDWPAGTKLVYRVRWASSTHTRLSVGDGSERSLEGTTDLGGVLTLRSFGPVEGGTLLGLSLSQLEPHSVKALGAELLTEVRAVEGHEAYLVTKPNGALASVALHPADSDVFKLVAQWLATDLSVTLGEGDGWTAVEESSLGLATAKYTRGAGSHLDRTRARYLSLRGVPSGWENGERVAVSSQAAIELDDGHLRSLTSRETAAVTQPNGAPRYEAVVTTQLELVSAGKEAPLTHSIEGYETRSVGEVVLAADTDRRLLEARAAGLTMNQLLSDLGTWGMTGEIPDHARWLWRAVGVLKLNPERSAELIPLFQAPGATTKGRMLLLDLLAAAGHPQAQEALRELLESDEAKGDVQFAAMLQRAGLVAKPERETIAFVEARLGAGGDEGIAAAFTACAMAHKLGTAGDDARAASLTSQVRARLEHETDLERRVLLMRALGNSGLDADRDAVISQRSDPSPRVRASVALALRQDDSPQAAQALAGLIADAEPGVQRAALSSLATRAPSSDTVRQVIDALTRGQLDRGSDPAVVDLLGRAEHSPQVTKALELLLRRAEANPTLAARIRALLALG